MDEEMYIALQIRVGCRVIYDNDGPNTRKALARYDKDHHVYVIDDARVHKIAKTYNFNVMSQADYDKLIKQEEQEPPKPSEPRVEPRVEPYESPKTPKPITSYGNNPEQLVVNESETEPHKVYEIGYGLKPFTEDEFNERKAKINKDQVNGENIDLGS